MSSDELKGFKISDQVRQRVDRPGGNGGKKGGSSEGPAESVGFPRIEALVGSDEPDVSGLAARMATLQELADSGSLKEKAGAKKAAIAYERAADLIEHLLATKSSLQGGGKEG